MKQSFQLDDNGSEGPVRFYLLLEGYTHEFVLMDDGLYLPTTDTIYSIKPSGPPLPCYVERNIFYKVFVPKNLYGFVTMPFERPENHD